MPLPDRETIKADLLSLVRERGDVSPSEAYAALACQWRLTAAESERTRSGRRLYEHEIRWARQELVIEGLLARTDMAVKASWRLRDSEIVEPPPEVLSRMLSGFLNPDGWFLAEWLPRYEATVQQLKQALAEGEVGRAVDIIWRQQ